MERARLSHHLALTAALVLSACAAESDPEVRVSVRAELEGPELDALKVVPAHLFLTDDAGDDLPLPYPPELDVLALAENPVTFGTAAVPAGTYDWVFLEAEDVVAEGAVVHNVIETTGLPPLELRDGDDATIEITLILLQDVGAPSGSLYVKGASVRVLR